jgi:hypothetical protein
VHGDLNSPYFTTLGNANKAGQNRGDNAYSSFYIFRLNDHAVLSLDWPKEIPENDEYISIARRLLYLDVAPAIGKLLDCYKSLAGEVGLKEWPLANRGPAVVLRATADRSFQQAPSETVRSA